MFRDVYQASQCEKRIGMAMKTGRNQCGECPYRYPDFYGIQCAAVSRMERVQGGAFSETLKPVPDWTEDEPVKDEDELESVGIYMAKTKRKQKPVQNAQKCL